MNAVVQEPIDEVAPIWQLRKSQNLEPDLAPEVSDRIAREAVEGYEQDEQSRAGWLERSEASIKLALQMVEKKTTPWDGAANVKFPLITVAALQFAARAYPALVKAPDLVQYRKVGADPGGVKAARAQRISHHMSWQLLDNDEDWEEDTDQMFITVPIIGCAFKKSFYDPVARMNKSRLVMPQNLVVNYHTKKLEHCERKTEVFDLTEREYRSYVAQGIYSDKPLGQPVKQVDSKLSDQRQGLTPPPVSAVTPRKTIEQHAWLDLDGDGYQEPYVITVDVAQKKTLRIVARFAEVVTEQSLAVDKLQKKRSTLQLEQRQIVLSVPPPNPEQPPTPADFMAIKKLEAKVQALDGQISKIDAQVAGLEKSNLLQPKLLCIKSAEAYTKYGFIPSPDGGFYDLGLGALLGPVNDTVNTLINQLLDAGTMQNGSTGFIGKGARIQGGDVRFRPYEWKRVQVAGQALKDSIVPLPVNEPSVVLFNLLSLLISYGEKISSVNEAMTGSNPGQNTPAYNMQAMLEQGLQVFNAIFKRLYRSFRKELRKLYVLNQHHLDTIEYYETLDGDYQVLRSDYSGDSKDVMPAADPNAFSSQHNLMKAQFLASRAQTVAGYDPTAVEQVLLEAMDIADRQRVFPVDDKGRPTVPPPGPSPEVQVKVMEEQRRAIESQQKGEHDAIRLDAELDEMHANTILIMQKAKHEGASIEIDEFEAITNRMKARAANVAARKPKASSSK